MLLDMYKGVANSPETTITNNINNTDTIIYVLDETRIPEDLPNLMVLGTGVSAETIKVLSIEGNAITVERGFQGIPRAWNAGTIIARNFTEYDYNALVENVKTLKGNTDTNAGDILSLMNYVGNLESLDTVEKSNIVLALNEIYQDLIAHKADYTTQIANRVKKNGDILTGVYSMSNKFINLAFFSTTADTETTGLKIKTNIPARVRNTMMTVVIEGYDYFGNKPIQILLSFYTTSGAQTVHNYGYSSINSFQPEIKIAHENNKVVIWMKSLQRFSTIRVDAITSNGGIFPNDYQAWSIVNEGILAEATDVVIVPFKA